jgi:hypothetical protein
MNDHTYVIKSEEIDGDVLETVTAVPGIDMFELARIRLAILRIGGNRSAVMFPARAAAANHSAPKSCGRYRSLGTTPSGKCLWECTRCSSIALAPNKARCHDGCRDPEEPQIHPSARTPMIAHFDQVAMFIGEAKGLGPKAHESLRALWSAFTDEKTRADSLRDQLHKAVKDRGQLADTILAACKMALEARIKRWRGVEHRESDGEHPGILALQRALAGTVADELQCALGDITGESPF